MSGNPPRPEPEPKDDLAGSLAKLRATLACLEALAPFDKATRIHIVIGVLGFCDEELGKLIAAKMGFKP